MSDNAAREPSPREKVERLKVLARRAPSFWLGAALIAAIVFTTGIVTILRMPRIYESETVILGRDAIRTDPRDDTPSMHAQRLGPKIKDLLLARSRLERIILEFNLYSDVVERFGMLDAVEEMRAQIGFRTRDSDMFVVSFQSEDRDLAQQITARLAESMIEEFVRDHVSRTQAARNFLADEEKRAELELEEKGRALAEFLSDNPQFAWDPTRGFPATGAAPTMGALPLPSNVISDPELASLQREKARLEERLGGGQSRDPKTAALLQSLEEARAQAQAALAQAQVELTEKRQRLTEEHPDVIAARGRAISAGRAFGEADAALSKARASLAGAAPVDPKLREQLATIRSAIAARERVLASSRSKPSPKKNTPATPSRSGWGSVELETEWQRLVREVSEARNQKEDVANKRARAELTASATMTSGSMLMTVIDPAFRPTRPIKPKRMVLGGVTLALSSTLGVLWAFARVLMNDTIFDALDIESKGGPKVLVSIPRDPLPEATSASAMVVCRDGGEVDVSIHRTVTPAPDSRPLRLASVSGASRAAAMALHPEPRGSALVLAPEAPRAEDEAPEPVEVVAFASPRSAENQGDLPVVGLRAIAALRALRFRIEQLAADGGMVVGITSPTAGEGKSRLAVQLALALSESERSRVLLVEANLERPSLARLLGVDLPESHGFSTQMRKRATGEACGRWGVAACGGSLHLLAESHEGAGAPGMLHSRHFQSAIDELRPGYDYIVIDGPSVLEEGGAMSVERVVDGLILLARAKRTQGSSLLRAASMLGGERVLGVVLTDVEET